MTSDEFTAASIAILRTGVGWQTKIAERLGISRVTVFRWLKLNEIPGWAVEKLAEMMGARDLSPWPRDEWILGDALGGDGKRREYIVHTAAPRFVARVVAADDDSEPEPGEHPADTLSGTVYSSDGYLICEIEWIDDPRPGEITQLMEAAADEIDRQAQK